MLWKEKKWAILVIPISQGYSHLKKDIWKVEMEYCHHCTLLGEEK